jgi:hypothetical protein
MELKEWIEKNKNWFIYPIVVLISFYFFSKLDSNKKNKTTQVENVSVETQIQTPIETITLSEEEIEKNRINEEKEEKLLKKNEVINCLTSRKWDYKEFVYSFKKGGNGLYYIGVLEPGDLTWKYNGNNNVIVYIPYIADNGMNVTVKTNGGCNVYFPY